MKFYEKRTAAYKMKIAKKITVLFMAVVMLMSVCAFGASAEETKITVSMSMPSFHGESVKQSIVHSTIIG